MSYVVLEGNFNKSVALAEHFDSNQDFGNYYFIIRNCSDYTDAILDVAEVKGVWTQRWVDGDVLISIPVLREFEASVAQKMDEIAQKVEEKN